jgi:hypothetical protein
MEKEYENKNYLLSLDVSTTCIGIALFDIDTRKLKLLHHVSPSIKPKPVSKMEELFKKVEIFEQKFLFEHSNVNITKVIIEEPLLQSNNVYTIATLLRFNGMIAKSVYDTLGVVPEFISSYDSRKYAFPELMAKRKIKKDGTELNEKQISKNEPVLFGDYPFNVDKKQVIWDKVSDLEPQVIWLFDKHNKLKKENYDMSDSYAAGVGFMKKNKLWV